MGFIQAWGKERPHTNLVWRLPFYFLADPDILLVAPEDSPRFCSSILFPYEQDAYSLWTDFGLYFGPKQTN